ncbi:hypothetical protein NC652_001861 [Populus alba x Populus x berolinensis]|nr:hypothetical protein NC652_001861 [Populus alba x Populus x berolinensis]
MPSISFLPLSPCKLNAMYRATVLLVSHCITWQVALSVTDGLIGPQWEKLSGVRAQSPSERRDGKGTVADLGNEASFKQKVKVTQGEYLNLCNLPMWARNTWLGPKEEKLNLSDFHPIRSHRLGNLANANKVIAATDGMPMHGLSMQTDLRLRSPSTTLFLTELDGVEVLTGVFVFAATSRPDLLDAALLRPGRLDRLLFCDFPSRQERQEILAVLSRKLPLANDVDIETIAGMTEGFSGADLQALLSDAQLAAVHEHLSSADMGDPGKMPVITDDLLKTTTSKARPSISEAEKQRLFGIYSQFLDSKRSVASQSRDTKGKRATLA